MPGALDISRNTVSKHVRKGDFSPEPPVAPPPDMPTMWPYARTVESWLEADPGAPRKRRHAARRVFDSLRREKGYESSQSTVERLVRE